jgi:hypothetical protein
MTATADDNGHSNEWLNDHGNGQPDETTAGRPAPEYFNAKEASLSFGIESGIIAALLTGISRMSHTAFRATARSFGVPLAAAALIGAYLSGRKKTSD